MDQEPEFTKFTDFLKGMLTDSNQAAQEAGFNAVTEFLSHAPMALWYVLLNAINSGGSSCENDDSQKQYIRATLVPIAVEKGFAAHRQGAKSAALELLLLYIEMEASDYVIVMSFSP